MLCRLEVRMSLRDGSGGLDLHTHSQVLVTRTLPKLRLHVVLLAFCHRNPFREHPSDCTVLGVGIVVVPVVSMVKVTECSPCWAIKHLLPSLWVHGISQRKPERADIVADHVKLVLSVDRRFVVTLRQAEAVVMVMVGGNLGSCQ